jgi:hypothetical protein
MIVPAPCKPWLSAVRGVNGYPLQKARVFRVGWVTNVFCDLPQEHVGLRCHRAWHRFEARQVRRLPQRTPAVLRHRITLGGSRWLLTVLDDPAKQFVTPLVDRQPARWYSHPPMHPMIKL